MKKFNIFFLLKILISVSIIFPLNNFKLLALDELSENNITKSSLKKFNHVDISLEKNYLLGPGDFVRIIFQGLDIYTTNYLVDKEGFLRLPEIGYYKAQGKTILEVKEELIEKYDDYIYNPELDVLLVILRPVKVYIRGEVRNPGLFNLRGLSTRESLSMDITKGLSSESFSFPKLFEAIKEAGGVTNYADLSRVKIIRNNPKSFGGGKIKAEINLLDLIIYGNQDNNINVYDGDIINILKNPNPIKEQILTINKSNINPAEIPVFISGNVEVPGRAFIKRGSGLVQAIASTGGKRIFSGKVEFIRFSNDGSIMRRIIKYDPNAELNSFKNPVLVAGDVINVKRTPLGVVTAGIREVATPIGLSFGLSNLFGGS